MNVHEILGWAGNKIGPRSGKLPEKERKVWVGGGENLCFRREK